MKVNLLISSLVIPLYLAACDSKQNDTTKKESDPKDIPLETAEIKETVEDEKAIEEQPDDRSAPTGAIIGAAAGGIIGHQSGTALEGAAIGEQSGTALEGAIIGGAIGGTEPEPADIDVEDEE